MTQNNKISGSEYVNTQQKLNISNSLINNKYRTPYIFLLAKTLVLAGN